MGISNIGVPQVANRAIIPLAVQAGLADLIKALVPVATDKKSLLFAMTSELESAFAGNTPHPALDMVVFAEVMQHATPRQVYSAINMDVLDKLLEYLNADPESPVVEARSLPETSSVDGPEIVTAERADETDEVEVLFSALPVGEGDEVWLYEIYLDLLKVKSGDLPAWGDGLVHESINVTRDDKPHSVRVLFVTPEGALTRFGPAASFT